MDDIKKQLVEKTRALHLRLEKLKGGRPTRQQMEEALAEERNLLRTLIDSIPDSIYIKDAESRFVIGNVEVAHHVGAATPDELAGKTDFDFHPKELAAQYYADEQKIIQSGQPLVNQEEHVINQTTDQTIWNLTTKMPLRDTHGKIVGIVGIGRDITEQKHAQKKLLDYQAQLKALASELFLAEERERRRLAVAIHEHIGQKLALAKLTLESLKESVSGKLSKRLPPSNVSTSLDEVCVAIEQTIQDAHSLTFELSNPVLYELGFETAVEKWLKEQIQEKYEIKCKFTAEAQPVELSNELSIILFQAVRELLVNVVKHAKADRVEVSIRKVGNGARVTVKDNGVGFLPSKLDLSLLQSKMGGFGLFSIQERLEYLGGQMNIKSAPGQGTCVTLTAPLKRKKHSKYKVVLV